MPPIAQRLREPAAFVLLGYGAISTLFLTITFLFGPGTNGEPFSNRAQAALGSLDSPLVTGALVGAVVLAHLGTHLKTAKVISLIALISVGVELLFGVVALFSMFGVDSMYVSGWGKTVSFFTNLAALALAGVGGWLILGYFQQHGPVRPANPYGQQPPAGGQAWGPQQPQQQWQPPQTGAPAPQPWGPPAHQAPPPPQQPWGAPPPGPQGGFNAADSMATQVVPTVQPQQQPQQPQQDAQGGGSLPVGNWTSEG